MSADNETRAPLDREQVRERLVEKLRGMKLVFRFMRSPAGIARGSVLAPDIAKEYEDAVSGASDTITALQADVASLGQEAAESHARWTEDMTAMRREMEQIRAERDRALLHLRGIVEHWYEFGPDYGLGERIDAAKCTALSPDTHEQLRAERRRLADYEGLRAEHRDMMRMWMDEETARCQRIAELVAEQERVREAFDKLAAEWEWRVDYYRLSADGLDGLDAHGRSSARGQQWGTSECLRELRGILAPAGEVRTDGVALIAAERMRQKERWPADHDDGHGFGMLAKVAAVLAAHHTDATVDDPEDLHDGTGACDPWGLVSKHGRDPVRCLTIAGALIAAEIDRLQRVKPAEEVGK